MQTVRSAQLTLVILLLCACSGTGRIAIDDETQAGNRIAQQIEEQIGLYPAEFLAEYVDAVGRRLVAGMGTTPYYFRFRVIDEGKPSAFASPGGYIHVSRGLLALLNSEDELAGVLAHEIIHVTQHHHARQVRRSIAPGILASPGRAIDKVVGDDIDNMINAPIDAVGGTFIAAHGYDQETEADRLGMELAARAGYSPGALARALYNLERTVTFGSDGSDTTDFFDSHPTTPTRIDEIERLAAGVDWEPVQPFAHDKQAFLDRLNGLTWGPANAMQGILRAQHFLQPDMDISIDFPNGWHAVNTPLFVGAFAPENEALVILGGAERSGPAADIAAEFIEELRKKADIEPAEALAVQLETGPAYLVRIEDPSSEPPVSIFYLWVNARNTTFRIIGVGSASFSNALRDTVLSLRNLTSDEKLSIFDQRIRIVLADAGETIEALSKRTDNAFSPELTAAVNGLPDNVVLTQDQLIKILRREQYLR